MRFLCFHGMGTNGNVGIFLPGPLSTPWQCFSPRYGRGTDVKVFERQTATLRQALGRTHEFVFLTGTVPSRAPGEVDGHDATLGSAPWTNDGYRFLGEDRETNMALLNDLIRSVLELGPFDGVMGFSEGGAVAASLLVEDTRRPFARFRCGIFLSAARPPDPDNIMTGSDRRLDFYTDGVVLNIPTAHIWSPSGEICPGMGRNLALLCNQTLREEFVHLLGHQVPGSVSDEFLSGTIKAIERTVERARASG
ncbi:Serine hydrolase (FSH1) domain containing protein [Rhypophila sp. PSN 637]